jgi:hypothetical protein
MARDQIDECSPADPLSQVTSWSNLSSDRCEMIQQSKTDQKWDRNTLDNDAKCKEVFAMQGPTTDDKPQVQSITVDDGSRWRKLRLRMSVRALMICVVMVGVVLGCVVYPARVQRDAVIAIRSGGGHVTYDWQIKRLPSGIAKFDPTGRPNAPKWLLDYLGHDFFGHVEELVVGQRNTDAVMKQVGHLDKLRRIRFSTLSGLSKLGDLSLQKTQVGDEGSAALVELTALVRLNLNDTHITDITLGHLARMRRLKELSVARTSVTDRGLATLTECKALRQLNVRGTKISRESLKAFQRAHP